MDLSPALIKIFPLTFSLLSVAEAKLLQAEFAKDWGQEQLHFFPMLVRHKKMKPEIVEVADYEYLQNWLKQQKIVRKNSAQPLTLNPNVQFVWIEEAAQILNKEPGLYILWKWNETCFELQLSKGEALILDRLQEDQILLRSELSEGQILILNHLISLKIVFENLKEIELNS